MREHLPAALLSGLMSGLVAGPSIADDTELYVAGGAVVTSRPQVLIIFDNSGSMKTEESLAPPPFDPTHDYTGNGGNRIYYVKGASSTNNYPNPRNNSERRYIEANQNGCADSVRPHPENNSYSLLEYGGIYTNNFRSFQYNKKRNNGRYWTKVPDSIGDNIRNNILIDCKADLDNADPTNAGSHPVSGLQGSGFPTNSNKRTPYDGSSTGDSNAELEAAAERSLSTTQFGSNDTVTLFTENYLAYFHSSSSSSETRLKIAKDTVNDLIISTAGVDFGLAVFNYDTAGRIVYGVREMTDSNRSDLIDMVNSLPAETWTPLCETLFEAYRYYAGGRVHKGTVEPYRKPRYDDTIINNGRYDSPMLVCQPQSYVVLITDGKPTEDNSFDNTIKSELGLTNADKVDGNLLAGVADKLYTKDLNDTLQGQQRVVTYTVGFSDGASDAEALLKETAFRGGGEYYPAANAQALQGALQEIFSHILAVNASFTSPSIAANSFDRTRTLDSVYYAMFLPSDRPRWLGNLKKLKINSNGEVVDQKGRVAIDSGGDIADNACTFWTSTSTCSLASSGGDGNEVSLGGVLAAMQSQHTRKVLTSPSGPSGQLAELNQATLEAAVGGATELMNSLGITDQALVADYIAWLQGFDVDDDDDDLSTTDRRFDLFGDPLHSKPLAINYGNSNSVRILVGTNYGMLHMFEDSGSTVKESWSWYLPEFLENLAELRQNNQTGGHTVYGVDGSPVLYVTDKNLNGKVDVSQDKVWVFFGLRRGGRSYHALDITNPDTPKLMWRIDADDLGMSELGQTWSDPTITTIPGNDGKPVVVVGAGYDLNKDGATVGDADSMGRGIFILDAESGDLVHRFVAGATASDDTTLLPTQDSIPNQVTVFDSDGDGMTDRLYATDTGANIWRIDIPSKDVDDWSVFKFAELGGDTAVSDRRFHAGVSVAQTSFALREEVTVSSPQGNRTIVTNSEVPYDAVTVGTGNRAHPNAVGTQDYLFALQDRYILTQTFGTKSNPIPDPIRLTGLYDVSDDPFGNAKDEDEELEAALALGSKQGWYYTLSATEKSLSDPIIIAGSVFFTTFTPGGEESENSCVSAGTGNLYEFSLQEGIRIRTVGLGARLPDTPQIVVPPPPTDGLGEWDPTLHLIGVGTGDDRTGTIETDQQMVPNRVYYHTGN